LVVCPQPGDAAAQSATPKIGSHATAASTHVDATKTFSKKFKNFQKKKKPLFFSFLFLFACVVGVVVVVWVCDRGVGSHVSVDEFHDGARHQRELVVERREGVRRHLHQMIRALKDFHWSSSFFFFLQRQLNL
jgi:hypothetical protein